MDRMETINFDIQNMVGHRDIENKNPNSHGDIEFEQSGPNKLHTR